jgi:hypothetical protein
MGPLFVLWFWLIVAIGPLAVIIILVMFDQQLSPGKKVLVAILVYGFIFSIPIFFMLFAELINYLSRS